MDIGQTRVEDGQVLIITADLNGVLRWGRPGRESQKFDDSNRTVIQQEVVGSDPRQCGGWTGAERGRRKEDQSGGGCSAIVQAKGNLWTEIGP